MRWYNNTGGLKNRFDLIVEPVLKITPNCHFRQVWLYMFTPNMTCRYLVVAALTDCDWELSPLQSDSISQMTLYVLLQQRSANRGHWGAAPASDFRQMLPSLTTAPSPDTATCSCQHIFNTRPFSTKWQHHTLSSLYQDLILKWKPKENDVLL